VLVAAGSVGMTGAAYLACEGALLIGSGLVTCAVPKGLNAIMEAKLTEAITLPVEDKGRGYFSLGGFPGLARFAKNTDAAAVGPGVSQNASVKRFIEKIIRTFDIPIVLDADGINCLAGRPGILKKAKAPVVITPHPGEMSRLIGRDTSYIQKNRTKVAVGCAKKYGVTVVLKGKGTVVASPDGRVYVNKTGNPGMATGGVGDILTGMIAGLIGQKFTPFEAAKCGVYVHGLAGDLAAKKRGEVSLLARDVLDNIPMAVRTG